jgi:L-2-hydroxycarboxylate dehydrogenase (NAD+)
MDAGYSWVPFDLLEAFMVDVFKGVGVPDEDARICASVLIDADKRGIDSHGVGRLKTIYYDRIVKGGIQKPVTQFEVVRDRKATAVVDGHDGMGMVIGRRCMQMAIDKARDHGLGMVVARNSTHYGFAAYYPLMAVDVGMVGLTGTNARPSIAPTHGVENMLGTNPLVFAMPTDEPFPFTNDYATSVIQRGKIEQWAREGKDCPPGLVINQQGESATDSVQILKDLVKGTAALAPIGGLTEETGGYKGYGFATVVEIMSAAFSRGAFLKQLGGKNADGKDIPIPIGHFFLAIDVDCLCEGSGQGAHLHLRREGACSGAGARGQGCSGGSRDPAGVAGHARCAGPEVRVPLRAGVARPARPSGRSLAPGTVSPLSPGRARRRGTAGRWSAPPAGRAARLPPS